MIDVDDRLAIGVGESVAGLEPEALAALAGTPFYAYDFDVIERRLSALRDALPASIEVAYATKANPSLAVVAHLAGLGAAGDIASAGDSPRWIMPTAKPPTRLTRVMMMAATASPLTNLEAPSIAP